MMSRLAFLGYGLVAYVLFLGGFLYACGFMANVVVPRGIDAEATTSFGTAMLVNTLLIGLFGLHHSVAARPTFKRWWTQFVPPPIERSTYVFVASLLWILLLWQWQPMPQRIWTIEHPVGRNAMWVLFALGWAAVPLVSFLIDHFDLFGLRQVWLHFRGKECKPAPFVMPAVYRIVRHPLMWGWLVAFWATPDMTAGHLLFAATNTVYILIAIRLEERNLADFHGESYARYREQVPMLLPFPRKRPVAVASQSRTDDA